MRARIVHVYQHYQPERGGIADFLAGLTAELARDMDQIILTSSQGPGTRVERGDSGMVVRTAALGSYYTPVCPAWPRWIGRLRPNIVHIHLPCPMAEVAALLTRPRRLVVSVHNDYVRPALLRVAWGPFHRATLRLADRIVVSSEAYAATSPALRAVRVANEASRLTVIPYGVELYDDGHAPVRDWRALFGPRLVVFLGRLCYYKGVEYLIDAAREISGQVLIVGDGDWREQLLRRAGTAPNVRFLGPLSERETLDLLRVADVFALPSTYRSEAFGIAQLKAMACGCPVVTTDLPGVSWVNRHGETGLVVPQRDAAALASAINLLLEDRALRDRLAHGARLRAHELSHDQMCDRYRTLYEECLGHAG
jgi:glycosyltransferase involved in cell wall biosynthesis